MQKNNMENIINEIKEELKQKCKLRAKSIALIENSF